MLPLAVVLLLSKLLKLSAASGFTLHRLGSWVGTQHSSRVGNPGRTNLSAAYHRSSP